MTKRLTYYKATRPDGTDFYRGTIDYASALHTGDTVTHPHSDEKKYKDRPDTYLSISISPTDCTAFRWPAKLFEVEPIGKTITAGRFLPNKRGVSALKVTRELEPHELFGPQGVEIANLITRAGSLTMVEIGAMAITQNFAWYTAWNAARYAARHAAWNAAWNAAGNAAWNAAGDAARNAAGALVVRDLVSVERFHVLYDPWASVMN